MSDKVFADGMIVKFLGPFGDRGKAPEFIKSKVSFKCSDFLETMKKNSKVDATIKTIERMLAVATPLIVAAGMVVGDWFQFLDVVAVVVEQVAQGLPGTSCAQLAYPTVTRNENWFFAAADTGGHGPAA